MEEGQRRVSKAEDSQLLVKGIKKSFGGVKALDGVDLTVPKEKLTMIIGPNGSGKTTLLNVISGFLKPEEGRVFYRNNDITGLPPHIVNKLGIVRTFQIPNPFTNLTVLENMLVSSRLNPGESFSRAPIRRAWLKFEKRDYEKALTILKDLRLDHLAHERANALSGGQMKLLEIGRALMNDADTILMDEPAAGVNPTLAHNIFTKIKQLIRERGLTFLIIEHRLDIALQYVDYVYAMARGRVISHGKPEEVVNDPLVVESYLSG